MCKNNNREWSPHTNRRYEFCMIIRNPKSFHRKRATTEIVTGHFLLNGTSKQVDSEVYSSGKCETDREIGENRWVLLIISTDKMLIIKRPSSFTRTASSIRMTSWEEVCTKCKCEIDNGGISRKYQWHVFLSYAVSIDFVLYR